MTKIEEKIDKASESYVNTCLNRCRFRDKRMRQFDAYDLETAFEQGAKWALSHQWVSVEDALPEIGQHVIWHYRVRTPYGTWINGYICDSYDGEYKPNDVEHWMPIPPLPEARKEEEV